MCQAAFNKFDDNDDDDKSAVDVYQQGLSAGVTRNLADVLLPLTVTKQSLHKTSNISNLT